MEKETDRKRSGKKHRGRFAWIVIAVLLIVVVAAGIMIYLWQEKSENRKSQPHIVTVSQLKEIIDVSELSTFTAVYNGVAQVMNKEKPEETDYYVSYEARVDVGIDFSEIGIDKDDEEMIIRLTIPEVDITDVVVDIASLDYIFLNDKANAVSVSQEAYKACEEDVKNESAGQEAIFELAEQNAENIVTALVRPVVEPLGYTIEIK